MRFCCCVLCLLHDTFLIVVVVFSAAAAAVGAEIISYAWLISTEDGVWVVERLQKMLTRWPECDDAFEVNSTSFRIPP